MRCRLLRLVWAWPIGGLTANVWAPVRFVGWICFRDATCLSLLRFWMALLISASKALGDDCES